MRGDRWGNKLAWMANKLRGGLMSCCIMQKWEPEENSVGDCVACVQLRWMETFHSVIFTPGAEVGPQEELRQSPQSEWTWSKDQPSPCQLGGPSLRTKENCYLRPSCFVIQPEVSWSQLWCHTCRWTEHRRSASHCQRNELNFWKKAVERLC